MHDKHDRHIFSHSFKVRWAVVLMLGGCHAPSPVEPAQPVATVAPATQELDLNALLSSAPSLDMGGLLFIAEGHHSLADDDALALPKKLSATKPSIAMLPLDISISRLRAAAAAFHINAQTRTPVLIALSPEGLEVYRQEGPITSQMVSESLAAVRDQSPALHARLAALKAAVTANPTDMAAQLALAQFLDQHHDAVDAIPHYEVVAHSDSTDKAMRTDAWVALARAHLYVIEPEKARHEARALMETFGTFPAARAGGLLVLGIQDANAKRIILAQNELSQAVAAAPTSSYAHEARGLLNGLSATRPSTSPVTTSPATLPDARDLRR